MTDRNSGVEKQKELKNELEHLKDVLYEIDMQNRMAKNLIRKLLKNPLKFEIRTAAENFLRGEK